MRAETISIGTELLLGQITDTNAVFLAGWLARNGLAQTHRQTVGDNLERCTEAIRLALSRSDVVFTIGGLGPTPDDLTRAAIAAALDEPLIRDPELVEHLRSEYGRRGLKISGSQLFQADRPACAEAIPNLNGTAPGLHCQKGGKHVVALPGPKGEFVPMVEGPVAQIIGRLRPGPPIFSRTLRVVGVSEASIGEQLADLMAVDDPTLAPYAKTGEVHLRATTRAASQKVADAKLELVVGIIRERLGKAVYAEGEESLEAWTVATLATRGATLTTAESCTGGLLAGRITSVDGSSQAFHTGYVTYSAEAKEKRLGVQPHTLLKHGTVSEETAREMAQGARGRTGATYAISVTGVAGATPLEEPPEPKPSGLVYIGIAGPQSIQVHRFHFRGDRATIRDRAVSAALISFRDFLLESQPLRPV
ncbi:MAG: competence/damage-inducible protein A [Armatimonadetes bacterium]|nr:competence/damage-inducible protein A [Armatimonadota bacterium]